MSSSSSSWIRVAQGAQKVITAVGKNVTADAAADGSRVIQHAIDLSIKFHASSTATTTTPSNTPQAQNASAGTTILQQDEDVSIPRHQHALKEQSRSIESSNDEVASVENEQEQPKRKRYMVQEHHQAEHDSTAHCRTATYPPSDPSATRSPPPTTTSFDRSPLSVVEPPSDRHHHHQHARPQSTTPVPATRVGRALGFAQLGWGLAYGSVADRLFGNSSSNEQNAHRLATSLCRMRGAALKLGQMLSLQQDAASLLPDALTKALAEQGADAMPVEQWRAQLEAAYSKNGNNNNTLEEKFVSIDPIPFAAASIGQVHRAVIRLPHNNDQQQDVVVKVQYPGVAQSIASDLRNLGMLVQWSGMAPPGLFLENILRVAETELTVECDYRRERQHQQQMQRLVENDTVLQTNQFKVPQVYEDWCTESVLVGEYCTGSILDRVSVAPDERNRLGRTLLYLTMQELFVWRFMQTDPNVGNFLYDISTRTTSVLDFGAARAYDKTFVDGYLRLVWAAANRDKDTLLDMSHRLGFLTGQENDTMLQAHVQSGFTVGEPFCSDRPFDFRASRITERMREPTTVFLRHRLTPPPEEVYTLHRKLAGAYMLCIKLGAVVSARELLEDVVAHHDFEDDLPHPIKDRSR